MDSRMKQALDHYLTTEPECEEAGLPTSDEIPDDAFEDIEEDEEEEEED